MTRSEPIPKTISSDLSPFIAESIRQRRRDRAQLDAIRAAATAAGWSPETSSFSLSEMIQLERWSKRQRVKDKRRDDRRRARLAGAEYERVDRGEIIRRDNSTCYLCSTKLALAEIHLDHVIPLARGGSHTASNLRVACAKCNLAKGAMTLDEYLAL